MSGQVADGDVQANQAAYNYNAWYQVSIIYLQVFGLNT